MTINRTSRPAGGEGSRGDAVIPPGLPAVRDNAGSQHAGGRASCTARIAELRNRGRRTSGSPRGQPGRENRSPPENGSRRSGPQIASVANNQAANRGEISPGRSRFDNGDQQSGHHHDRQVRHRHHPAEVPPLLVIDRMEHVPLAKMIPRSRYRRLARTTPPRRERSKGKAVIQASPLGARTRMGPCMGASVDVFGK